MRVNQTAESYLSAEHCASLMACCTTARSSGSCCGGAAAAATASWDSSRAASKPEQRSDLQAAANERQCIMRGKVLAVRSASMTVLQCPGLDPALTDDDAMRNADQLGVGELDAGSGVAIVV